jgi:predicted permease
MVVGEIAAALVLVLGTLTLVGNLAGLQDVQPGFQPDGVFQARVSIPPAYRSPEDISRFYERLSERLASAPGVTEVGVITVAPLTGLLATVPFTVATESTVEQDRTMANLRAISPAYLATVGTRIVQGRALAETDTASAPQVALVSAALADRFLPSGAIGRRLLINDNNTGPRPVEIVGVVENVRHTGLDVPAPVDIYLPFRQLHPDRVPQARDNQFWMVKTASDPEGFRETFAAHLRAIDPDAAVSGTGAMRRLLDDWLGPRRFNLGLFTAFALTALALAGIGLYGLVSYAVSQRAGEIGLRMAIGATQGNVQWMIVTQAVRLGIVGTLLGLGLAALARPLLSGMVPDVSIGTVAMAGAASVLVAVVLVASWLPARRAARIEPTLALRCE